MSWLPLRPYWHVRCKPCYQFTHQDSGSYIELLLIGIQSTLLCWFFDFEIQFLFHCMNSVSLYWLAVVVDNSTLREALTAFYQSSVNHVAVPQSVETDGLFQRSEFQDHLKTFACTLRPFPPYCHIKNTIESRHLFIRDIFVHLCLEYRHVNQKLLACKAVRISNNLYGNDVSSAYELVKVYLRVIHEVLPFALPDSIHEGHEDLVTVQKLNRIFQSKAIPENVLNIGSIVHVFRKCFREIRGEWFDLKPVLNVKREVRTVSVFGSNRKTIQAVYEDTTHSMPFKQTWTWNWVNKPILTGMLSLSMMNFRKGKTKIPTRTPRRFDWNPSGLINSVKDIFQEHHRPPVMNPIHSYLTTRASKYWTAVFIMMSKMIHVAPWLMFTYNQVTMTQLLVNILSLVSFNIWRALIL